jgi:Uma2 family endonuclease
MKSLAGFLPRYTYEDYKLWEGDWELIGGLPVAMSPSSGFSHQKISGALYTQLNLALKDCPDCHVLYGIDWIISEDTVVRPDIIVICHEPQGEYITKTPEIIFEVVSPFTAQKDEKVKYELYEKEGVKYYGLVYPEFKVAKIYNLEGRRFVKLCDASHESVEFLLKNCKFKIDFGTIWY